MRQADLFSDQEPKKETLKLTEPTPDALSAINNILNKYYRTEDLNPIVNTIKRIMTGGTFVSGTRTENQKRLARLLKESRILPKRDMLFMISYFFATVENFDFYFNALPMSVQQVWILVMDHYYVSSEYLKQETGMDCIIRKGTYFFEYVVHEKISLFRIQVNHVNNQQYICLPSEVYTWFSSLFLPRPKEPFAFEAFPADKPYLRFNGEKEMSSLLLALELQVQQSPLTTSKLEKLKWSTARKLNKAIHAQEFFPKATDNIASSLRSMLLFDSFSLCRLSISEPFTWDQSFAKFSMPFRQSPAHFTHTILPHLSGLHQRFLDGTGFVYRANQLWDALTAMADQPKWQDADQFVIQMRYKNPAPLYNMIFTSFDALRDMEPYQSKLAKRPVKINEYYTQIGIPFVKGFLFWMAAWGLIEIAYEPFNPKSISYFDTLRYFRVTELGRYALGKTESYEFPPEPIKTQFELDEERLLLRSLHPDNPIMSILSPIVEPLGGERYKMSSASFLKPCETIADVEKQIQFFHQYITPKPPKIWADFFEQMRRQSKAWSLLPPRTYELFRIEKGDAQLLRILSSDSFLREHVRRAEDYIVLVETNLYPEVRKRLKAYGYLL